MCFGASKALQAPSEPVIRVLATMMPPVEISHVVLARGVIRLQINMMFVLIDEHGEMHAPKDNERREIELQQDLILRSNNVQSFACVIALRNYPLPMAGMLKNTLAGPLLM